MRVDGLRRQVGLGVTGVAVLVDDRLAKNAASGVDLGNGQVDARELGRPEEGEVARRRQQCADLELVFWQSVEGAGSADDDDGAAEDEAGAALEDSEVLLLPPHAASTRLAGAEDHDCPRNRAASDHQFLLKG